MYGGHFLPKRIENPLTSGLPSKVCFLSYLNPSTGYSLAKKIHGYAKGTDKIYKIIDKLLEKHYLTETEVIDKKSKRKQKPVTLVIEKLILELENALAQKIVPINYEKEPEFKKKITSILNSSKFKEYLGGDNRITNHVTINFGTHDVTEKQEFNGLQIILETIGLVSTLCFINRKFKKKSAKEDLKELEKIYKKSNPNNWMHLLEGVSKFNLVVPLFEKFNEDTLIKLSTLWPPSHIEIYSHYIKCFENMEKMK